MDRVDRAGVATFLAPDPLLGPGELSLGAEVAHHMRVRRLAAGDAVQLVDGAGGVAQGVLTAVAKSAATVRVLAVAHRPPPLPVHLLVPVADRDRTLWLAEKCTELGLASWRPVRWRRSHGVATRGEGEAFEARVRARMAAALVQSEGGWLPHVHPAAAPDAALAALPASTRLLLDPDGVPLRDALGDAGDRPVVIALGPEGGFERSELDALAEQGFRPAALPGGILRFETAGVAALALTLAALPAGAGASHGR